MFDLRDWLGQADSPDPTATETASGPSVPADEAGSAGVPEAAPGPEPLQSSFDLDDWLAEGVDDSTPFVDREPTPSRPGWRDRAETLTASVPPLTGVAAVLFLASIVVLATGFSVPGLVDDVGPDGSAPPASDDAETPTPDTPQEPDSGGSADDGSSSSTGDGVSVTAADGDDGSSDRSASQAAANDRRTERTSPTPAPAATPAGTSSQTATRTPSPSDGPTQTASPTETADSTETPVATDAPTHDPDDGGTETPDDGEDLVDDAVDAVDSVVNSVDDSVGSLVATAGEATLAVSAGGLARP